MSTDYWTRTLTRDEILALGREHADLNGLRGWTVKDAVRSVTTAGWCKYGRRTIELNCDLMEKWPYADVLDVVLHEIAHAISYRRHGREGKGHGRLWKEVAVEVGAEPTRCYESHRLPKPEPRWMGTCLQGHTQPLVRQPSTYQYCTVCKDEGVEWPQRSMDFRHIETGKRPDGKRYTQAFRVKRIWEAFREAYADGSLPPHHGAPENPYEMFEYDGTDLDDEYFVIDIHRGDIKPLLPDDDIGEAWWR